MIFAMGRLSDHLSRATSAPFRTLFLLASILLYVTLQGASTAHAVEFGTGDHTHDGKICTIASFSQRGDDVDVPAVVEIPQPVSVHVDYAATAAPRLTPVAVAAAQPRGPPTVE